MEIRADSKKGLIDAINKLDFSQDNTLVVGGFRMNIPAASQAKAMEIEINRRRASLLRRVRSAPAKAFQSAPKGIVTSCADLI